MQHTSITTMTPSKAGCLTRTRQYAGVGGLDTACALIGHAPTLLQVPFVVPMTVNVGLVGLNGDGHKQYHLDKEVFQRALSNSLDAYVPSCFETGSKLDVQFDIMYNVGAIACCVVCHCLGLTHTNAAGDSPGVCSRAWTGEGH